MPNERGRAYAAVWKAVRGGELAPPSRETCAGCGQPARLHHHGQGYSEAAALQVTPLCSRCHAAQHGTQQAPRSTRDDVTVHLRLSRRLQERLRQIAQQNRRGVSNQVIVLLEEEIARRGEVEHHAHGGSDAATEGPA
jgi:hypothetical protein